MLVIGDVHGCYKTLCALIRQFPKQFAEDICFVGDMIDRGPDSKKVIQLIKDNGYYAVLGNHEAMAIEFNGDPYGTQIFYNQKTLNDFGYNGGVATLESYKDYSELLTDIDFFKTLPVLIKFDELRNDKDEVLVVSHSAIGNHIQKDFKSSETISDIIWNRDVRKGIKKVKGCYNIFGHTIHKEPLITDKFACIDTGVLVNRTLTAIEYPSMKVYQQELLD